LALPHYDEAMSFSDTIFLFFLALILFGPKKLPEMARQAGRLLAELRRASNEFKSQIETEIAHLEVEKPQTALPPRTSPQGTVASLIRNLGAGESVSPQPEVQPEPQPATPAEVPATLAAPELESAVTSSGTPATSSSSTSTADVAEPGAPTSQASHV